MTNSHNISSLTLGRLSVYLRCLRRLQELGVRRISSKEMAHRFGLSATLIRKDLAQFGEFGIRGVGYDVETLRERLESLFGLDREHPAVIVGAGNIGTALARFPGFNRGSFRVVAVFDNDPAKVGTLLRGMLVRPSSDLGSAVRQLGAEIGILAVPAAAAQENYDALVEAGVRGVLNFAPVQIKSRPEVRVKTVDLMIFLEELAFYID